MTDQARQTLLCFGSDGVDAFVHHSADQPVNQWAERLDQIIGQRESVKAVMMMQPDCRVKPCPDDRPCDAGSHHGVAIVQQSIGPIGVLIAAK